MDSDVSKSITLLAGVLMLCFFSIELLENDVNLGNCLSLLFTAWCCFGSWHVLDLHEKGQRASLGDIFFGILG